MHVLKIYSNLRVFLNTRINSSLMFIFCMLVLLTAHTSLIMADTAGVQNNFLTFLPSQSNLF